MAPAKSEAHRLDLVHVPIPLGRQGSTLMAVAQSISDISEATGHHTGAVLSDNRALSLNVSRTYFVDYTANCPLEWFTRAELARDFAAGALGALRPSYGRLMDPAINALAADPPKVVLLYEGHYAAASLPRWERLRSDSRIVLYVHNPVSRSYGRRELDRLLGHADRIVFCADHLRRNVEDRLGRKDSRLITLPNGVNPKFFAVERSAPPDDDFTIAFIGRIVDNKGVHLVLEAAELARFYTGRSLRVIVVGSANYDSADALTPYELKLRAQAAAMSVPVEFLPFADQSEVLQQLQRSAVACLPSLWSEGLPLSALEAMATGLPVITSDSAGMVEACGDAAAIVPSGDPAGMAREIARLANDAAEWSAASAASRRRATRFSWHTVVEALV